MHVRLRLLPTFLFLWLSSCANAANFTFSYGKASQCDNFQISWTGGSAPFELTLVPVFGTPQILSIPSTSFSNGVGSFEVPLSLPQKHQMLAVMSDASGFASGGVSNVITVGPSSGTSQCNTTTPGAGFTFNTDSALAQCRTYTFSDYTTAIQPVTIFAMIPGGTSFILQPPNGPTSFDWVTNVASSTELVFFMMDSQGHSGGSSQVNIVGLSDDATCLTGNIPASVANPPSATSSITSNTNAASSAAAGLSVSDHSSVSTGTAVGAVIGGLLGLAIIIVIAVYLFRRRQQEGRFYDDGSYAYRTRRRKQPVDLMHDPTETLPPTAVHVEPYTVYNVAGAMEAQGPALSFGSTSTFLHQSSHNTPDDVAFSYGASTISLSESQESAPTYPPPQSISSHSRGKSSSSGRRKKSTMGGTPSVVLPARFILHTDAEEVVELPPQYSERLASSKPPRPSEEDSSTPSAGTYPLPPPRGPSLHTPSTPIPSPGILEEEDQGSDAILQVPMSPGPPSSGSSPRSQRYMYDTPA